MSDKKKRNDFKHIGDKKVRKDVFKCVAPGDMPDGAYFAMAEEFGLEPEDLVDD
jgi:hypothetical protein